jgi:pilus assembly protein CpaE
VVAESVTANLLRAAMQRGVSDVIEAPLTEEKIAAAISQFSSDVLKMQASRPGRPTVRRVRPTGEIVTVMSAKGGSGKTVTATNLAVLLAQKPTPRCAWSTPTSSSATCAWCCSSSRSSRWSTPPPNCTAWTSSSRFDPHAASQRPEGAGRSAGAGFADDITTAGLLQILELLKTMFDYVVVDTASLLDELLLSLLEKSDQVLMVVDMDLPSVKNAKLALETLRLLKFPTNKVRLVLNRSNAKARLDDREIEGALKSQIMARIPSDGDRGRLRQRGPAGG